ncbi:MAG: polymorphic toxin-type HINT domain-containing protein [Deltaproteobacteria bacterium]|nr:polymorphic toxin-type HINT domain-containing protein [Deltaproteobacteria bacterium]
MPATTSTTVSYEYAHDLFLPGELFHRDAGGGYASVLATELSGTIDLFDDTRFGCASAGAVPDVRPTSGDPCAVSYPSGPYPGVDPASDFMWLTLKRAVADNIVRIAVDGEIELETRYEVSPFKINFDHVIEQRYGQVPSPLPTPENIVEGDSSVHRWHTNLPRSLLEYLPGNTEPPGFTLADTTHGPLEDPDDAVVIPALCNFPDLEDVPAFFPQVPVGPRVDLTTPTSTPSLKRTAATCEQLAGRWTGRLDAAGLSVSFHDDPLVTRGNRAWDLNLICEWVKETDRRGAAHWHGLNFEGTELVGLHPSPAAPTLLAATSRLVNADGFLVKETRPDGAIAEIEYEPPSRFGRHLPTKLTERAGTASHLIAAVTESLNGTSTSLSERETRFFWEPLFQQPLRIERPDLSREHFRYDWQQLGASTAEARALLAGANDHGIAVTPSNFLTVDIDGDGDRGGESSAQEVLRFIEDAALGGGVINDVGTRTTRDETGRMTDTWAITNADNAATDFNRTSFTYYENLPKAEAGDLSVANCKKPCGPLATLTRHRTSTATSADHLDVTFMAYDALGGVRLSRENGDAATNTVILRDGLGRVFEEQHPFKLVLREFDGQGRAVVETHNGNDGKTIVTRFAWGLADTALGSCAELVGGACNDFQAYALGLFRAVRAGTALPSLPAALTQADFTVGVVDVEDAPTHVYGPFGLETQRTLSLAGLVTNEKIEAGSDQHHRLVYDVEGRVLSHSTGTSTTDVLRTLWRYDRFGRATDIQTRMPLANTTVSTSVGSLERAGYDVMDRVVRASTLGDTGLGTRRVLRTLRHELNALGLPLFSHYGSASSLPSTVPAKSSSGASATDAFATESFRYDPALRLTRVDREGILTPWTAGYDHFGATALTGPAIKKRSIAHIPRTRTTTTDTSWRPEGAGAVTTGVNTLVERDVRGLIERVTATDATAGVKQQSEFEYDGLGRLERQVDPTGRTVVTTWGPLSRPSKIDESGTDGLARTTVLNHDARGRVLSSDPSDAPATEYDYDVAGNLIFEQSGDISTSWDRDSVGRMEDRIRGVRGNERAFRWTYDANQSSPSSLLVDGTAAKSWLRDGLDRPIVAIDKNLVLDADASNSPTLPSSRGTLTTSVRYDVLGRVVADETLGKFPSSSPTAPNSEVLLSESARSHGTAFLGPNTVTFLSGERLNKTYGDNGDVVGLGRQGINGAQLDIALSYQGRQWVRATLPNSLRVTKERDGVGNVRSSSFQIGTTTTFSEDVIRGPTGRVVGAHTTTTFLGKRLLSHRYDGLARLKQTSVDLNTAMTVSAFRGLFDDAATSEAFNPVTASDAIAVHARGEADTLTSSTSDEQGRKFSALYDGLEAGVPPTKINGRSIDRDEQDRIEADGTLSYVFDALDRLVLVTRAGSDELRLTYDGFGRRRLERRREGVTGTVINDVVLEYDGGNVVEERLVGGAVLMGTLHAPELDAPLLVTTGPLEVVSWFGLGTAVRGDVTHAVDATGSVVEEQLLDAFGERELSTGGTVCVEGKEGGSTSLPMQTCKPKVLNLFGISGARQHPRTKLVDLRNRVYATHLRGFLSKDPLGNIDSDGLWNYVAGDPVNFKDPWGLEGQGAGAAVTSEVPINPAEPQVFPELRFEVERCNAQCRRNNAVTTAVAIASRSRRPEPPLEQPEEPGGPSPDAAPGGGAGGPGPGGGFVDGVGSSLFDRFMLNIRDVLTGGPMNPFRAADALKNLLEDPASIIPGVGEGRLAGALVRDCPADSASCGKAVVDAVEAIVVAIAVGKALGGPKSCSGGKCTGPSCFTAGTLVRTSRGLIPIASIVVGDVVLARHETTGEWGWFPVVQTFVRPTEQLVTIEVEGADSQPDLFETTPEHPFFVDGRGWVEAGGVSVGDRLEGAEGTLTVVDVRLVDEDAQVFNLEVEAAHTYFVGELSALVHNGECPGAGRVIDETKNGQGNIGSAETLPAGQALKTGADWVGPGYKEVGGNGTGVFRSADGTRQFRIDNGSISGSHGSIGPHVHLETVNPNRSGRAAITVNNHVPFTE